VKDHLIAAVDTWCREKIILINQTYQHMEDEIGKSPANEKELVDLRAFILESKDVTCPAMIELHHEVQKHYLMLDDYFFEYSTENVEACIGLKTRPTDIECAIAQSREQIEQQEETMKTKLENEQNQFAKDMLEYEKLYENIITFSSFSQVQEYMNKAYQLSKHLNDAEDKVDQFKNREALFGIKELTEYPKLEEVQTAFKPFYELIETANQVKS
jgi:hypothetical protein